MVGKTIRSVEYLPPDNPTKITIAFTDSTRVAIWCMQAGLSIVSEKTAEDKNDPSLDEEYQWRMMVE